MNTILFCMLFFFSCALPSTDQKEETVSLNKEIQVDNSKTYYGEWIVSKFYSPPLIAALENYMEKSEAKTYLNKTVMFQENESVIFNSKCNSINYFESKEKAFDYIYYNHRMVADTVTGNGTRGLHPEQLGIKTDSIEVVEISCDDVYYNLFVVSPKEIIIEYKSTFFFLKRAGAAEESNTVKEYSGTGSKVEELPITGAATVLNLSYEFYKEADQLTIEDQDGKELFSTEMTATNGIRTKGIPLRGVTKLVLKVKGSQESSKWKIKVEIK